MDKLKRVEAILDDQEARPYKRRLMQAQADGNVPMADAVFSRLTSLFEEDCQRIARTIEKSMVEDTQEMAKMAKDFLKTAPGNSLVSFCAQGAVADEPKAVQTGFHVFDRMAQIRGEAVDIFLKAFVVAAKKLSDDERKSATQLVAVAVKAYDAVSPTAATSRRPNTGF